MAMAAIQSKRHRQRSNSRPNVRWVKAPIGDERALPLAAVPQSLIGTAERTREKDASPA